MLCECGQEGLYECFLAFNGCDEQIQMAFSLVMLMQYMLHVQDPPSRAPQVTCLATSEPRSSLFQDIQPELPKLST